MLHSHKLQSLRVLLMILFLAVGLVAAEEQVEEAGKKGAEITLESNDTSQEEGKENCHKKERKHCDKSKKYDKENCDKKERKNCDKSKKSDKKNCDKKERKNCHK